jgi:hypothetical protein
MAISYAIHGPDGDSGPFNEVELRERLRDYRDAHGDDATFRDLAVWEMRDGGTAGNRLSVGQFLDD